MAPWSFWSSPSLPLLESSESDVSEPDEVEELSPLESIFFRGEGTFAMPLSVIDLRRKQGKLVLIHPHPSQLVPRMEAEVSRTYWTMSSLLDNCERNANGYVDKTMLLIIHYNYHFARKLSAYPSLRSLCARSLVCRSRSLNSSHWGLHVHHFLKEKPVSLQHK